MTILSFLIFFALLAGSLPPAPASARAAELLAAAAANGVPPPPAGAWTWILARLATALIPFGSPALRANLLGAALMAGAVPLVADGIRRLLSPRTPPMSALQDLERRRRRDAARWTAAILWALSPGPWRAGLSFEAETIGLFFAALFFWMIGGVFERGASPSDRRRRLRVMGFGAGLFLLPQPLILLLSRRAPALDYGSPDNVTAWLGRFLEAPMTVSPVLGLGLLALALTVPAAQAVHWITLRRPRLYAALFALLPLLALCRLLTAAREDLAIRDLGENLSQALPAGALLWDPTEAGAAALLYQRSALGRREDILVARRSEAPWARAEFRRRHPAPSPVPALLLSPDLFFLEAARTSGSGNVFTDDPARLPELDPATGLPSEGRFPEDALPEGAAYQFFPAASHRLVDPASQIALARVPLWAARPGAADRRARARMDLGKKFSQEGIVGEPAEEALAALAADPGDPAAHRLLGEAALARGEAGRALVHFQRSRARGGDAADVRVLEGAAARAAADAPGAARARAALLAGAVEAFRAALSLDPSLEEARRALAEILESRGDWKDAARQWSALMDRNPKERLYPWRLAQVQSRMGRLDKARAALREYLMFPLEEGEKADAEVFEKSLERAK